MACTRTGTFEPLQSPVIAARTMAGMPPISPQLGALLRLMLAPVPAHRPTTDMLLAIIAAHRVQPPYGTMGTAGGRATPAVTQGPRPSGPGGAGAAETAVVPAMASARPKAADIAGAIARYTGGTPAQLPAAVMALSPPASPRQQQPAHPPLAVHRSFHAWLQAPLLTSATPAAVRNLVAAVDVVNYVLLVRGHEWNGMHLRHPALTVSVPFFVGHTQLVGLAWLNASPAVGYPIVALAMLESLATLTNWPRQHVAALAVVSLAWTAAAWPPSIASGLAALQLIKWAAREAALRR